jgi:hypothetical protein
MTDNTVFFARRVIFVFLDKIDRARKRYIAEDI